MGLPAEKLDLEEHVREGEVEPFSDTAEHYHGGCVVDILEKHLQIMRPGQGPEVLAVYVRPIDSLARDYFSQVKLHRSHQFDAVTPHRYGELLGEAFKSEGVECMGAIYVMDHIHYWKRRGVYCFIFEIEKKEAVLNAMDPFN